MMQKFYFIICFLSSIPVLAQSGVYVLEPKHINDVKIKWTLSLNEDGTFLYHFIRDIGASDDINPEENFYGKGTWKADKNLIVFTTNKATDLDEKHTLDFSNTIARYTTKSTRNTSDTTVKTTLRFFQSNLFYIKGLELFKQ